MKRHLPQIVSKAVRDRHGSAKPLIAAGRTPAGVQAVRAQGLRWPAR